MESIVTIKQLKNGKDEHQVCLREVQSNLFNTDTKGTEPSVHFTEVIVL